MAQHTTQPWHYDGGGFVTARFQPHSDGICRMLFTDEPGLNDEVVANAELIAEAPVLYDIVHLALRVLNAQQEYFSTRTKGALVHSKQLEKQLRELATLTLARIDGTGADQTQMEI